MTKNGKVSALPHAAYSRDVSSRSSCTTSLQVIGLRNAIYDFGEAIVELERFWIERAIGGHAVEKTLQIVADPCCERDAYFGRMLSNCRKVRKVRANE